MAVALSLDVLVLARELPHGAAYAFPVADPTALERGDSLADALERLRGYLSRHLSRLDGAKVADFVYPEATRLLDVPVVIERSDLPRRFPNRSPLGVSCIVVPEGKPNAPSHWVQIPALGHTVFVPPEEELERRLATDLVQTTGARELTASEFTPALWPGTKHHLVRLGVEIERADLSEAGERASKRRRDEGERERKAATKLLEQIGTPLGRDGIPPIVGRESEIASLRAALSGKDRLCVVLVGPEMAGKSAVVQGLLGRALPRPIHATSGAALVAGQSGFGQLQQRVDAVMRAAELLDVVLYFDNLADLFAGHSGGIEDIASVMRPYLSAGRVRVIGELSPEQLEHHEKRHVGFFACLHRVLVEPLGVKETKVLLQRRVLEAKRREPDRPQLELEAIDPLCELGERYSSYHAFPGKAVRLYEELRAIHEGETTETGAPKAITVGDVYRAFSVRSGIPLFLLRDEQAIKHAEILAFFERRVIGQHEAIDRLAQTLCVVKSGLQPPAKPLANFLFVGPTGVGKTEVAKTLAEFLFGSADRMVRFDMSEYMDPLAAERLIRGSDSDDGELTKKVRQQPFCVVLLDEIEKAHPAVFDLLLQVCGEGRLTDARGKTTWFHNAIVIMTSNLGAGRRSGASGFGGAQNEAVDDHRHYLDQVERHFRPEFVNRLDRIVPFRALDREEIGRVTRLTVGRMRERDGLLGRGIDLRISDRALQLLAAGGYSDRYGARALRRHVEDQLVAPLGARMSALSNELEGAAIRVAADDEPDPNDEHWLAEGMVLFDGPLGGGAPLRVRLHRRPQRTTRQTLGDLQLIAALRRNAQRCLAAGPLGEIRERLDYLVADMAGKKAAQARELGSLNVEHAHLRGLLDAAEAPVKGLVAAEELAMAALVEGVSAELFCQEAMSTFAAFERAFVQAAIGVVPRHEGTFIARSVDAVDKLARFLTWLLDGAESRQWSIVVHRFEDPEPDETWPAGLRWGPPRSLEFVRERLRTADSATLAKQWRAVLLRVKGPHAGGLIRLVTGIWRFEPAEVADQLGHVELFRVWDEAKADAKDLASDAFGLPERVEADKLARLPAEVTIAADGRVSHRKRSLSLRPPELWSELERMLFGEVADAALHGQDLFGSPH